MASPGSAINANIRSAERPVRDSRICGHGYGRFQNQEREKGVTIACRCDDSRLTLSAHDCKVPIPTFENAEVDEQILLSESRNQELLMSPCLRSCIRSKLTHELLEILKSTNAYLRTYFRQKGEFREVPVGN